MKKHFSSKIVLTGGPMSMTGSRYHDPRKSHAVPAADDVKVVPHFRGHIHGI